jgi:hypothetical protein
MIPIVKQNLYSVKIVIYKALMTIKPTNRATLWFAPRR